MLVWLSLSTNKGYRHGQVHLFTYLVTKVKGLALYTVQDLLRSTNRHQICETGLKAVQTH